MRWLITFLFVSLSYGQYAFPPSGGVSSGATSVGLAMPITLCAVTGSPVTTTGTLTCSFATGQTANRVFATDASGNVGSFALTTDMLPTGIPNANLQNSSVTVNGVSCTLGGSCSTVTTNQNIRNISISFDGGGVALTGPLTRCTHTDYGGTIQQAVLTADVSGSATADVRTVSYSSYTGPASASSIAASAIPALSSAVKFKDSTLPGWTTTLAADSMVCVVLTSPSTITTLQLQLKVAAN